MKLESLNYKYLKHNKDKKTLVLIHGLLGSNEIWGSIVSTLSKEYSLLLIELPGHGKSSDKFSFSMVKIAIEIKNILHYLAIKNIGVIGHSVGGYIAGSLATQFPNIVSEIILINSSLLADSDQKKEERNRAIRAVNISTTNFTKSLIENLFLPTNRERLSLEIEQIQKKVNKINKNTLQNFLIEMRDRTETLSLVSKNKIPVLFISSIHDKTIPYQLIEKQIDKCNSSLITLDKSAHMSFIEEKNKVIASINSFLLSLN